MITEIISERDYIYKRGIPVNCIGYHYRVLCTDVIDVPSNQHKVLVKALDGPDAGLVPLPEIVEKPAGRHSTGSGV
jgi:hypothetical protein